MNDAGASPSLNQARRDRHLLFLSHCVPNPPQKGEKIRAFHLLTRLAERYSVHVACFAKHPSEIADARRLEGICSSVYVEPMSKMRALAGAAVRFGLGACLTTSFYGSAGIRRHVQSLRVPLAATVAYTSAMAQYAPDGLPMVFDLVDVDSEKWLDYAASRFPGWAYRLESGRLRRLEIAYARRARCTFLAAVAEQQLFQRLAPEERVLCLENGVDFDYFDPALSPATPALRGRNYIVFAGEMGYYPNVDGVCWFARQIFPVLRRQHPDLEFLIVGRNPAPIVSKLGRQEGITVTGGVEDIRPYVASARASVAPLRIARGIQNKVLEALALGKSVAASTAVCKTFGAALPTGVIPCAAEPEFLDVLNRMCSPSWKPDPHIRDAARHRFTWNTNCEALLQEVERSVGSSAGVKA